MAARTGSRISRPKDDLGRLEHDVTARVVDLRCIVKRRLTGETLFEVGGRWDRVDKIYLPGEPAKRGKVLWLNEAQVLGETGKLVEEGPAWAVKLWIAARMAQLPRVAELVLDGPRGSGKTHWGALAVWIIAIALPEAECWLVSPANTRRWEIGRIVKSQIPTAWRTGWSERDLSYVLPNHSVVRYLGADDEDNLKRGGYEVALLNEAQLMSSLAYANAVAGVRNVDGRPKGLLMLGLNYASKERGEWTNDHLDKIDAGTINARRYKLDPALNTSVDADVHDDVEGLIRSVRPDIADLDSLGIRKRLGDYASPAFRPMSVAKGGHIGAPLQTVLGIDGTVISRGWEDVTRRETAKKSGTKNGFPVVVCMDFQRRPGCVASLWRLYERADLAIVYHAQKVIVAGDNEDDLCQRVDNYLATLGLTARDALAVCDSTGRFQNAAHTQNTKPSHDIVREWQFTVVAPRRARISGKGWINSNPLVEESLAQFYDLCTADRILVADGEDTEWLVESLRRCKIKKRGGTIRLDDSKPGYSHPVDTARYLTWYFEPRRGIAPPTGLDETTFDELRSIKVFNNG